MPSLFPYDFGIPRLPNPTFVRMIPQEPLYRGMKPRKERVLNAGKAKMKKQTDRAILGIIQGAKHIHLALGKSIPQRVWRSILYNYYRYLSHDPSCIHFEFEELEKDSSQHCGTELSQEMEEVTPNREGKRCTNSRKTLSGSNKPYYMKFQGI